MTALTPEILQHLGQLAVDAEQLKRDIKKTERSSRAFHAAVDRAADAIDYLWHVTGAVLDGHALPAPAITVAEELARR
jgi:hypothetical protein